jgi:hypothetical protein
MFLASPWMPQDFLFSYAEDHGMNAHGERKGIAELSKTLLVTSSTTISYVTISCAFICSPEYLFHNQNICS